MRRHLLIISREHAQLFGYLSETLGKEPELQLILDRRFGERRHRHEQHDPERRSGDTRGRPDVDRQLRSRGYAFLCFD